MCYLCALNLLFLIIEGERSLQRREEGETSSIFKKWEGKTQHLLLPFPNLLHSVSVTPSTIQPVVTRPEIWTCLPAHWRPPASWRTDNSWSLALGSDVTLRHLQARWLWSPKDTPWRRLQVWAIGDSHQKDLSSAVPLQPNTGISVGVLVSSFLADV